MIQFKFATFRPVDLDHAMIMEGDSAATHLRLDHSAICAESTPPPPPPSHDHCVIKIC